MVSYIDQFLSLRCAADVIEAVSPLNRAAKEISESMALITAIRGQVLSDPGKWTIVDLCAGNALTGILAAHLLPVAKVIAVDKRQRIREGFGRVRNFEYRVQDITSPIFGATFPANLIIVASHPCKDLALKIIDIANRKQCSVAILACCVSRQALPEWAKSIARTKGSYFAWLVYLASTLKDGKFKYDKKCTSPCCGLVTAGL